MSNPTTPFGWQMPTATDLVTDLPADFEVFGQAVATSMGDLLGGTTGQVLAKASNADMDFVWSADAAGMTNPMTTTGDMIYSSPGSTPVRRAVGSTGQGLTVVAGIPAWAASATSTLTTTGDMLYASAANTLARRAVGSTGDVLTVAGGVPTWAAPGAAGANWSLLNAGGTALTGAQTITVSGISGKDKIMVLISDASSASANSVIAVQLNTDTASNYYFYGTLSAFGATYAPSNFSKLASGGTQIAIGKMAVGDAGSLVAGYCLLTGCNSSGAKVFNSLGGGSAGSSNTQRFYSLGGYYDSSSTISSISVYSDAGNFDNGTVYVYTSA